MPTFSVKPRKRRRWGGNMSLPSNRYPLPLPPPTDGPLIGHDRPCRQTAEHRARDPAEHGRREGHPPSVASYQRSDEGRSGALPHVVEQYERCERHAPLGRLRHIAHRRPYVRSRHGSEQSAGEGEERAQGDGGRAGARAGVGGGRVTDEEPHGYDSEASRYEHEDGGKGRTDVVHPLSQFAPRDRTDEASRLEASHDYRGAMDRESGVDVKVVGNECPDDSPRNASGDALHHEQPKRPYP
mmetsp:Transcript_46713/g.141535  ORF Transcript_46713/g.141535 Transcript_46713/m.141535 type:complete len:241 (-) Transcript_46713:314-1036(-)